MIFALTLLAPVNAAEVEVATTIPIHILVDGSPVVWDENTGIGYALNLLPGRHTVESRTLMGKTSAYKEIELAANERIRFEYRKKELWHVGTYTLPPAPAVVVPGTVVVTTPGIGITISDGVDTISMSAGGLGGSVVVTDGLNTVAVGSGVPVYEGTAVVVAPPAGHRYAMGTGTYNGLLAALDGADFSDEKMSLVRSAAANNGFTCVQLAGVLDRFDHGSDKVEAVGVVRPSIVDPQNSAVIHDRFTFSSDAAKAQSYFQ